MLDSDLAMLYQVETGALNRAVKRNIGRFPDDFRFQLSKEELENLKCQIGIASSPSNGYGGRRTMPFAYTEQGISILASVLHSEVAVQMSISIMRTFVELRRFYANNAALFDRISSVELRQLEYQRQTNEKFDQVFAYIGEHTESSEKLFFDGQIYDAHGFLISLIQKASINWNSEKAWYKANPSLGYTIQIDRVRDAHREALTNPAEENVFRQLRLDQWVGSAVAWIPEHIYDKGSIPIDLGALKGRECYCGLDLSSTSDITAFVMVFPPRSETERYIVVPHFWLPRETLDLRVRRDHVPYDVWERQGLFHVTEGNVVDYSFVRRTINHLHTEFNIKEIGVDRWNATQLITDLEGDGFTMVPIGMGFKEMSPGMKELYKLLLEGRIIHGGNPVLRWMAGNVVAEIDAAENIKPSKKKSTEKIDGIVAWIMGLDRAIRHEQQGSVYDDPEHGLWVF